MTNKVHIRPIRPEDGPALGNLIELTPSVGTISFTYAYHADAYKVSSGFSPCLHGAAALSGSQVIGLVFGDRLTIQLGGDKKDAMYVSNLRVHPEYRRQGVARGLSEYGIGYAQELLGAEPLLYAAVPVGNASMALVDAYDFQKTRAIQGGIIPMRKRPPSEDPGLEVREVLETELDRIASGMNEFYRAHNLWSPVSARSLHAFVNTEIAEIRPNKLYVVIRAGNIVGGLSLSDRTGLVSMQVAHMPLVLRALGSMLGLVPKNGILRTLTIRRIWFKEGELQAARYLWQSLRYRLRRQADSLGIAFDTRDRLAAVFQVPFWLPLVKARYAVRCDKAIDYERPVYCEAGP